MSLNSGRIRSVQEFSEPVLPGSQGQLVRTRSIEGVRRSAGAGRQVTQSLQN